MKLCHFDDVELILSKAIAPQELLKAAFALLSKNIVAKMRTFGLLAALAVGAHALLSDHSNQSISVASQNSNKHTLEAELDRVTSLPGAGDLDFELFAGKVLALLRSHSNF